MSRLPRISLPQIPQHVVQRGNNRQACFFFNQDYRYYLECLDEACRSYDVALHAYVLMTNHVHLLMTPAMPQGIAQVMQSLGRRYVRHINDAYQRSGTLWEGRYHSSLIESDSYLLTCHRYIELNPVRAGLVNNPGDYPWSSYRFYAEGVQNRSLKPHVVYLGLANTPKARQEAYRALIKSDLGEASLHNIRESITTNRVLGSERFKEMIENLLDVKVRKQKAGRPRKQQSEHQV